MEEEEGDEFLKVLRALRDAARSVESGADDSVPALHALLALEASADDLLAGDPELHALCCVLARVRALSWSVVEVSAGETGGGGVVAQVRARCRRCKARRGIARAAGDVAREIQAWIDRELAARLVAALRRDGEDARASALLAELEARLMGLATAGRFDARLQDAVLRHGVFAAVEARLADPDGGAVSDGCAGAVLALVRFNRDVFVGPVLMGPAVGALVTASASASSAAPLRALNGLVDAIRTPLVDELHGRGELTRLVALLCAADPRVRALAALRPRRRRRLGHGHGRRGRRHGGVGVAAAVRERGGPVGGAGGGRAGAGPAGEAAGEAGHPPARAGGGRVPGGGGHGARRGALGLQPVAL